MNDWIIACLNLTRSYPVTWVLTRSVNDWITDRISMSGLRPEDSLSRRTYYTGSVTRVARTHMHHGAGQPRSAALVGV